MSEACEKEGAEFVKAAKAHFACVNVNEVPPRPGQEFRERLEFCKPELDVMTGWMNIHMRCSKTAQFQLNARHKKE